MGYRIDMLPDESVSKLRASFEGRQAICVEKGALLVGVSDIRPTRTMVSAQVEEIPAPGLGVGLFGGNRPNRTTARRWTIRAGDLTEFSDNYWAMGYGGWSLYFEPRLVQAVLQVVAQLPDTLDTFERYNEIVRLLQHD